MMYATGSAYITDPSTMPVPPYTVKVYPNRFLAMPF